MTRPRQQLAREYDAEDGLRALRAKHYHEALQAITDERPPRQLADLEEFLDEYDEEIAAALEDVDTDSETEDDVADPEEVV